MEYKSDIYNYNYNPYTQSKCPICDTEFSVECIDNPDKNDLYDELWVCKNCNIIVGKTVNC